MPNRGSTRIILVAAAALALSAALIAPGKVGAADPDRDRPAAGASESPYTRAVFCYEYRTELLDYQRSTGVALQVPDLNRSACEAFLRAHSFESEYG